MRELLPAAFALDGRSDERRRRAPPRRSSAPRARPALSPSASFSAPALAASPTPSPSRSAFPIAELPGFPVSTRLLAHAARSSPAGSKACRSSSSPAARTTTRTATPPSMRAPIATLKALGCRHAHPHQRRRVAAHRGRPRRGDADHRPHRLLRRQSADRRADRRPLRRHDRRLRRRASAPRSSAPPSARASRFATGVYMWFSGPSFETPAEIRMARIARRRRRRHVDRAGGDPRPLLRPALSPPSRPSPISPPA